MDCVGSVLTNLELAALPRNGIARTGIRSIIADNTSKLSDQPRLPIKPCEIGGKINMPAEPAAVPRPNTRERFSALTRRAIEARIMPKEQAAMPSPTSTPPPIYNQVGVAAPVAGCEVSELHFPLARDPVAVIGGVLAAHVQREG